MNQLIRLESLVQESMRNIIKYNSNVIDPESPVDYDHGRYDTHLTVLGWIHDMEDNYHGLV